MSEWWLWPDALFLYGEQLPPEVTHWFYTVDQRCVKLSFLITWYLCFLLLFFGGQIKPFLILTVLQLMCSVYFQQPHVVKPLSLCWEHLQRKERPRKDCGSMNPRICSHFSSMKEIFVILLSSSRETAVLYVRLMSQQENKYVSFFPPIMAF